MFSQFCYVRDGKNPRIEKKRREVTPKNLADFLGPRQFFSEVAERAGIPGVATGLAWTPTGGEILFAALKKKCWLRDG